MTRANIALAAPGTVTACRLATSSFNTRVLRIRSASAGARAGSVVAESCELSTVGLSCRPTNPIYGGLQPFHGGLRLVCCPPIQSTADRAGLSRQGLQLKASGT